MIGVSRLRQNTGRIVCRPTELQESNNDVVDIVCQIMSPNRNVQLRRNEYFGSVGIRLWRLHGENISDKRAR